MANFCIKCGYKVDKDWLFCPVCGTKLPIIEPEQLEEEEEEEEDTNENIEPEETEEPETDIEPVEPKDHPTLPRKVDKKIFEERLKEYRLLIMNEKKLPGYCIFDNKAIDSLVEARNRILIKQDLIDLKYWKQVKIDNYGDDIIDILNQLDQNYIPHKK